MTRRRPAGAHELPVPARIPVAGLLLRVLRRPDVLPAAVRGRHAAGVRRRTSTASISATSRPALDPLYIEVFLRTLRTAAVGTVLIIFVGYPLAYWIARYAPEHRRGLFLALIIIPFWTSFLIRTYSFLIVLSPEFFLSDWLQALHLTDGPLEDPQHDGGDPDRPGLQLPAAVRAAALRDARADGLAARGRRDRPRREPVGGVPPDHAAPHRARPDHRHAARLHPDDGRVRDPARAGRRPRRLHRQRHPAARSSRPRTTRSARRSRCS